MQEPPRAVRILAPAKLNLFLEVLGRRDDGFHELETVMTAIDIYDTLVFSPQNKMSIELQTRWVTGAAFAGGRVFAPLPPEKENLAYRAVARLAQAAGVRRGARIELTKRIPSASGLGGGSSDAAAALLAANRAWRLDWPVEQLAPLAAELGSDVPFFLTGQTAICRGRGEQIERAAFRGRGRFVVVRPPQSLATADVYRRCEPAKSPLPSAPLLNAMQQGNAHRLAGAMCNRLQDAAEQLSPWIGRLRRELDKTDAIGHQMSGSGSAYFAVCRSARHARRIANRLRAAGFAWAVACSTTQRPPTIAALN